MMRMQTLPSFAPVRVELTAGNVTEATIHNSAGVHTLPAEIGKRRFFVALVEADGGEMGIEPDEAVRLGISIAVQHFHKAGLDRRTLHALLDDRLATHAVEGGGGEE